MPVRPRSVWASDRSASGRAASFAMRVEQRVGVRVDPAHEEAGHRPDPVDRLVLREARLQRRQVGLHHVLVPVDREQQRDVDVDPLGEALMDGRQAGARPRNLHHDVRPVAGLPEAPRLGDRAVGVVRQVRPDLDRHEAVVAAGGVVGRPEGVGGVPHVLDGQRLEHTRRFGARASLLPDVLVVQVGVGDRLLKDGRVRRHAAQTVLGDEAPERGPGVQVAPDVVVPDALPEPGELLQSAVSHSVLLARESSHTLRSARRRTYVVPAASFAAAAASSSQCSRSPGG